MKELPGDNDMLSPSKFDNAFKRHCVDAGEKERCVLRTRTREYLYNELRRKHQTDRLESSLVIDHGAALRFYNIERIRAMNFVPIR